MSREPEDNPKGNAEMACPRKRLKTKPYLSPSNQRKRLEIVSSWIQKGIDWKSVIFSDEKRFQLDGPDCMREFWCALGSDRSTFASQSPAPRRGVMIWAAIKVGWKSSIVKIEETMNSAKYCRMLQDNLLPHLKRFGADKVIFQQDNAPCHASRMTKAWLDTNKVPLLQWPAKSPDLSPIENA
jgi:hypothetical protein